MLKLGTGELIVILTVALLIFGPSRLPALGKMVGKTFGTLRHYANTDNWADLADEDEEDEKPAKTASKKTEEEPAETQTAEEPPAASEEAEPQTEEAQSSQAE